MTLHGAIILITGGCGQVGVAIARHIRSQYPTCKLHVLDLATPASSTSHFVDCVVYHECNITDESAVKNIFISVQPEVVFHTAGLIPQIAERLGMNQESNYIQVNVEGTRNLLKGAKALGSHVKAFIYTSSADVVKGNSWDNLVNVNEQRALPAAFDNAYAKSKAIAESLVTDISTPQLPTTAIRAHAVFGDNDNNLIPLMLSAPRNLHLGPGTNVYDFTYGPNLAEAHTLAAINLLTVSPAERSNPLSAAGKAFFVTNAEPMPFREFLTQVWTVFDGKGPPKGTSIPRSLALPLVWMAENISKALGKKPTLTTKDLGDSLAERWFDNSRAREVFGYVPKVKIADGLKKTAEQKQLKEGDGINIKDAPQ